MRRFVDRSFPARSLESDAADLMRTAGPSSDAPEVKQRVRERLLVARVRPRARFVLAPAIVVIGLAIGTAAGATLGVRWWRGSHASPQPVARETPRAPLAAARAVAAVPAGAPAPAQAVEIAAPVAAPERAAPAQARRVRPAAEDRETSLLFAATRALRRDRDPARAGALLDDYFRRFPRGVLAEEALAVAIEAASARGDLRAHELARRYLQRYPSGQFRKAAERALAGPAE